MANSLPEHPPAFPPVTREEWRAQVQRELGDQPLESLVTRTEDGLELAPLYTAEDAPPPLPMPGVFPYARGSRATSGGWDVRVSRAEPAPAAAAALLREELAGGATSVRLQLAIAGMPAVPGVRVATLDDLDAALEGAHLEMIGVALDAGGAFLPAAAALVALWERRGTPPDDRRGELGADPLGALARDGALPTSLEDALVQLGDVAAYAARELPGVRAVRVSTAPYHDAGGTAVQELGIALATGLAYLRAMAAAGLTPREAAGQVVFDLAVGTEQFQEIAKLRALRLAWARVLERVGAHDAPPVVTVHLARRVLTRRDPWVNMLRATMAGFVGATGGADAITLTPYDAALGEPDEPARRLARNTQHILLEEAHVAAVADPAGGSWFVESLTRRLAERAWEEMRAIEQAGGMAAALTSGAITTRIAEARARRERAVATRARPITGVSEFPDLHEPTLVRSAPAIGPGEAPGSSGIPDAAREALDAARRDLAPGARTRAAIAALAAGAPLATVVERIGDATPASLPPLEPHAIAEPFERLRDASDAHRERTGSRPCAFVATLGPLAQHGPRAGFVRNLLEAGGVEAILPGVLADADDAARRFAGSGASVAVIATSDEIAAEHAPATARALRAAGARLIAYAGRPGASEQALRDAGVVLFLHLGVDMVAALRTIHDAAGVTA